MIIQIHNFNENFNAAIKAQDVSLLFTIFSGELADLFTQREPDLFELFSQCGIKYNVLSVYEVYVDKVLKAIKEQNEDFISGLSFLIADNNNEIEETWEEDLDGISTGIYTISEYLNDNNQNYLRQQILDAIQIRLKPDNKRNLYFQDSAGFTIVFLFAVAVLVYYVFKPKKIELPKPTTPQPPEITNPAFNVSPEVLIPESQMPPKAPEVTPNTTPITEAPKIETPKTEVPPIPSTTTPVTTPPPIPTT